MVNGKLETQLGILSDISEEEARRNIRNNREAYDLSVDEMTKERKFNIKDNKTQYLSESGLQSKVLEIFRNANFERTTMGFKFTGDTTEFDKAADQVMNELGKLQDEALLSGDRNIIEGLSKTVETAFNKNYETIKAHLDNYKAYLEQSLFAKGFGDELSEYARRTQEYNDALLSGNMDKIVEAKSQLDEYQTTVDGILGEHPEYGDFFNEIKDSVDTTTEAIMNFKDIIDDGVAESTNGLKDYADVIRDTVNRVKKMELDPVDVEQILLNGGEGFDALSQLAKLFNKDFDFTNRDQVRGFADILAQLGVVADETAQEVDLSSASFTDFMHYASDSIDTIDKVNSALVNAFASGGLSAGIDKETGALTGDVAEIIKAYSGLEGFDVANIFERTAKGVIVNRDALRELQKQQEETLKDEFGARMTEAWNEWKKAVETGDVDDASYWKETAYAKVRGEMYFGNSSPSWNHKGVAFFDPNTEGTTYMKLYSIKRSQLLGVQRQEGLSDNWYGRILCLGIRDDRPIYTFTSRTRRTVNLPDKKYLTLIATELKRCFALTDEEVISYIMGLILRSTRPQ